MQFPFRIPKLSARSLDEWAQSEYGRYEDALLAREEGLDGDYPAQVSYEIVSRYATVLRIDNASELAEAWWSLCSGTFQHHCYVAASNLSRILRPFVLQALQDGDFTEAEAASVRMYARPSGF